MEKIPIDEDEDFLKQRNETRRGEKKREEGKEIIRIFQTLLKLSNLEIFNPPSSSSFLFLSFLFSFLLVFLILSRYKRMKKSREGKKETKQPKKD